MPGPFFVIMMYKPTLQMSMIARKALALRDTMQRGNKAATATGIKRAHQFSNQTPVTLDIVVRTYYFLTRNRRFKTFPEFSKGRQAWLMWGGQPAYNWSKKILKKEGLI